MAAGRYVQADVIDSQERILAALTIAVMHFADVNEILHRPSI
jgi:hypothetical protein